jgi:hypothetical protein
VDNQTVIKLKEACEPYWVMFKKLKEKSSSHHLNVSARKTNAKNYYNNVWRGRGRNSSRILAFREGVLEHYPRQRKREG